MAQYRTAQGKMVDMSSLIAKNEKTRAVGNMKVNARGDTIDSNGKVIQPVNAKVTNQYAKTVGNRSALVTPDAIKPAAPVQEEKLPIEDDFDSIDDLEIEKIKEQDLQDQEKKKGKK